MKKHLFFACLGLGTSFSFGSTPFLKARPKSVHSFATHNIVLTPLIHEATEEELIAQMECDLYGTSGDEIRTRGVVLENVENPSALEKSIRKLQNCIKILEASHHALELSLETLGGDPEVVAAFQDQMKSVCDAMNMLKGRAEEALEILNDFQERKEEWEGFSPVELIDEFTTITSDLLKYCREHVQEIGEEACNKVVPVLQKAVRVALVIRTIISLKEILMDSDLCTCGQGCPCLLI
ncbi:MAG: hypothetical protein LW808_003500 [Verrucomicrobiota bacterium]|nr:MAG: hypothetical protein LW808_003500 [Verrucomicrobiota bacterium]